MKKIYGMILVIMLGLGLVGCSSTTDVVDVESKDKIESPATGDKKEEKKEEEKKEEKKEEEVKAVVNPDDNKDVYYYLSNHMSDSDYVAGFKKTLGDVVEFDAQILTINTREGYDTRIEMTLLYGDVGSLVGPTIKIKDISYGPKLSREILSAGVNVRVKGYIFGYDIDNGWVSLQPISVEPR